MKIEDGEMVAIMGTSGSGKSTLLNILGFIDKISNGEYYFDGENVETLTSVELAEFRNKKVGFVFQYFALLNDYTVYENIQLPLLKTKLSKKEKKKIIEEYLIEFGITSQKNKRPQEISGGQQQRVAIIRALVTNPSYILADEPTGALDKKNGEAIMNILKDLNKNGKTIIIVTHDNNVANFCDRIITIDDGKIINSLCV
ncbi:ABC transporter ATP-binding protein [Clostridium tagluense]|uniref:ABC transporter ATP-binding protein n=1 Tax=Clostridium tagluense TaxID=360422 RepID=UPI001CF31B9D|nr:ABC transporter ATP-binding protein [Clostridium tagluense]MCB2311550.1 ABC transporter ATP-binding protein [Clostridium tagluense]MCB2316274.1 ABC transporter ATP-binding protein [Clostridium tagluense]MCB2321128.1 ABC transporter ATP-binding protein [Clostridium tagluense]MCB2326143.1 ABC transporter ATP-binding protein [Clostridium tagluense]MCB2330866.1 ABC transporter ATP-binding protein [Clostridium tagluense]